jgi:hypothetical protein
VADHEHVRTRHLLGDPRLLGARHEVVDEHRQPASRTGPEAPHPLDEVVDAAHRLDHDAELAQVVAPHPLQQPGVVAALDPDPRRLGDLGRRPVDDQRPSGGPAQPRSGGRRGGRAHEGHGLAVHRERAGPVPEPVLAPGGVAQLDDLAGEPVDRAPQPARPVQHRQADRRADARVGLRERTGAGGDLVEDVALHRGDRTVSERRPGGTGR